MQTYACMQSYCLHAVSLLSFLHSWICGVALMRQEKIDSKGLRRTVAKVVDYFRVLIFGTMVDVLGLFISWYVAPYCMILITMGIICIEGRSVLENSRKKKSHAADVADMAQKIVKCISSKDAEDLIEQIKTKVERK